LTSRLFPQKTAESPFVISDAHDLLAGLTLPSDESDAATLTAMIPGAYEELRRLAAGYLRDVSARRQNQHARRVRSPNE
jgi:hypothetical protein